MWKYLLNTRLLLFPLISKRFKIDHKLADTVVSSNQTMANLTETMFIRGIMSGQHAYIISNLTRHDPCSFYSPSGLWIIGRDPLRSSITVSDQWLSRYHALLEYRPSTGFILSDVDSRNGTYVNGKKLQGEHVLCDGDLVRLGHTVCQFSYYMDDDRGLMQGTIPETFEENE